MAMSRTNFFRKFRAITGTTPNDYLKNYRLDRAAQMILEGRVSTKRRRVRDSSPHPILPNASGPGSGYCPKITGNSFHLFLKRKKHLEEKLLFL